MKPIPDPEEEDPRRGAPAAALSLRIPLPAGSRPQKTARKKAALRSPGRTAVRDTAALPTPDTAGAETNGTVLILPGYSDPRAVVDPPGDDPTPARSSQQDSSPNSETEIPHQSSAKDRGTLRDGENSSPYRSIERTFRAVLTFGLPRKGGEPAAKSG